MDAAQARRLHEDRLLALANVTGVGTGTDPKTGADVVVVYVTRKVPPDRLRTEDMVPTDVEGVPVRVVAIGDVTARGEYP